MQFFTIKYHAYTIVHTSTTIRTMKVRVNKDKRNYAHYKSMWKYVINKEILYDTTRTIVDICIRKLK